MRREGRTQEEGVSAAVLPPHAPCWGQTTPGLPSTVCPSAPTRGVASLDRGQSCGPRRHRGTALLAFPATQLRLDTRDRPGPSSDRLGPRDRTLGRRVHASRVRQGCTGRDGCRLRRARAGRGRRNRRMIPDFPLTIRARTCNRAFSPEEKPRLSRAYLRADEGTRTLDLLHGKDLARGDWDQTNPTNGSVMRVIEGCQ